MFEQACIYQKNETFKMHSRRVTNEIKYLDEAISNNDILSYSLSENKKEITIMFKGPSGTHYENNIYKVKYVLPSEYPFKLLKNSSSVLHLIIFLILTIMI